MLPTAIGSRSMRQAACAREIVGWERLLEPREIDLMKSSARRRAQPGERLIGVHHQAGWRPIASQRNESLQILLRIRLSDRP